MPADRRLRHGRAPPLRRARPPGTPYGGLILTRFRTALAAGGRRRAPVPVGLAQRGARWPWVRTVASHTLRARPRAWRASCARTATSASTTQRAGRPPLGGG